MNEIQKNITHGNDSETNSSSFIERIKILRNKHESGYRPSLDAQSRNRHVGVELEKPKDFNENEIKEYSEKHEKEYSAPYEDQSLYTSYSKFHEMKLVSVGLASAEKIRQWAEKTLPNGKILGQINNANTLHHKTFKPQKGGLFCERIFGPLKDFECACGQTQKPSAVLYGDESNCTAVYDLRSSVVQSAPQRRKQTADQLVTSNGRNAGRDINMHGQTERKFCPNCDVEYTWSIIRRYQMGYIQLVSPVSHLWYLKANPSYLSLLLDMKRKNLENVIYCSETMTLENTWKSTQNFGMSLGGECSPKVLFSAWKQLMTEEQTLKPYRAQNEIDEQNKITAKDEKHPQNNSVLENVNILEFNRSQKNNEKNNASQTLVSEWSAENKKSNARPFQNNKKHDASFFQNSPISYMSYMRLMNLQKRFFNKNIEVQKIKDKKSSDSKTQRIARPFEIRSEGIVSHTQCQKLVEENSSVFYLFHREHDENNKICEQNVNKKKFSFILQKFWKQFYKDFYIHAQLKSIYAQRKISQRAKIEHLSRIKNKKQNSNLARFVYLLNDPVSLGSDLGSKYEKVDENTGLFIALRKIKRWNSKCYSKQYEPNMRFISAKPSSLVNKSNAPVDELDLLKCYIHSDNIDFSKIWLWRLLSFFNKIELYTSLWRFNKKHVSLMNLTNAIYYSMPHKYATRNNHLNSIDKQINTEQKLNNTFAYGGSEILNFDDTKMVENSPLFKERYKKKKGVQNQSTSLKTLIQIIKYSFRLHLINCLQNQTKSLCSEYLKNRAHPSIANLGVEKFSFMNYIYDEWIYARNKNTKLLINLLIEKLTGFLVKNILQKKSSLVHSMRFVLYNKKDVMNESIHNEYKVSIYSGSNQTRIVKNDYIKHPAPYSKLTKYLSAEQLSQLAMKKTTPRFGRVYYAPCVQEYPPIWESVHHVMMRKIDFGNKLSHYENSLDAAHIEDMRDYAPQSNQSHRARMTFSRINTGEIESALSDIKTNRTDGRAFDFLFYSPHSETNTEIIFPKLLTLLKKSILNKLSFRNKQKKRADGSILPNLYTHYKMQKKEVSSQPYISKKNSLRDEAIARVFLSAFDRPKDGAYHKLDRNVYARYIYIFLMQLHIPNQQNKIWRDSCVSPKQLFNTSVYNRFLLQYCGYDLFSKKSMNMPPIRRIGVTYDETNQSKSKKPISQKKSKREIFYSDTAISSNIWNQKQHKHLVSIFDYSDQALYNNKKNSFESPLAIGLSSTKMKSIVLHAQCHSFLLREDADNAQTKRTASVLLSPIYLKKAFTNNYVSKNKLKVYKKIRIYNLSIGRALNSLDNVTGSASLTKKNNYSLNRRKSKITDGHNIVDLSRKNRIFNNVYCLSHRYCWNLERNWQYFSYYNWAQGEFDDLIIPRYQHRIISEIASPDVNVDNTIAGAAIIQKCLSELNPKELRKMDKQNRILLYELNKKISKLKNLAKKGFAEKIEKKQLKQFCEKRDFLIRRTKLVRKLFRKNSNPESMILTTLPVLPPDLRPILKMQDQIAASDLNRLYQRVIYRNDRLRKFLKDPAISNSFEMKYAQRLLQEAVDNLIQNGKGGVAPERDSRGRALKSLSESLKGKQGRFRQYLLGKRVDYSGRSVIVVGPKLKLHECGLPKEMAKELFLPFLIKRILHYKLARTVIGAKTIIKTNEILTEQLLREILQSIPILLNRAPTLHRLGIQAFQPVLIEGRAILLHPLVCPAFNADFDGDQMAVHVPITVEARSEAWKLMFSRNNLISPATGDPIMLPSQDMVLGCYYLTTEIPNRFRDIYTGIPQALPSLNKHTQNSLKLNVDDMTRHYAPGTNSSHEKKVLFDSEHKAPNASENKHVLAESNANDMFVFSRSMLAFCFSNFDQVLIAYQQKQIDVHTSIWVVWNDFLEVANEISQPLEIRLTLGGYWQEIRFKSFCRFDRTGFKSNQLIRTTAGRVLLNKIIHNCMKQK
uniref:DNA-directed RNA polymerase subunit beta' n=1 Tax=Bracteacoccus giganteus TaxID=50039 RepID=A0A0S2LQ49_9CHLO|nr:beta' subunit of RNA polymerase [Bracteacoccus giganteus]ALO63536.1 beta' subunit of RNA polymerase [Bracteacoccus giganteus]